MLLNLRKISLVNQRKENDCVVACLAMVTGLGMEEIEEELVKGGGEAPFTETDYIPFLVRHNIYPEYINNGFSNILLDDSVYLMLCSGANSLSSAHMIVGIMYKGHMTIFDPNDDLENIRYYSSATYNDGNIPVFQYILLKDCSL